MLYNGNNLEISFVKESCDIAKELLDAREFDDLNEVCFHVINIDQKVAKAFIKLLRHQEREWKGVSILRCSGEVKTAINLAMSVNTIESLQIRMCNEIIDPYSGLGIALQSTMSLKWLKLTSYISDADVLTLAEGLRKNISLEKLDFFRCSFEAGSVSRLVEGMRENKHLKSLHLYFSGIEDKEIVNVAEAVQDHPTLLTLDLNGNKCGAKGASRLAECIQSENCVLRKLGLGSQHIDPNNILDISSLASALKDNTTLQILGLAGNCLDDYDADLLAQALCTNVTLQELGVSGNQFTDIGIGFIAAQLPRMRGLKILNIWDNPFGEDGAMSLLGGMVDNIELQTIFLPERFNCLDKIDYFLNINRGGRKLLYQSQNNVPISLWPLVLGRANRSEVSRPLGETNEKGRIDMLYCLLQGPALFARGFNFASTDYN